MVVLAHAVVGVILLYIVYMYWAIARSRLGGTKFNLSAWSFVSGLLILFWGVILLTELSWWFWPLVPGGDLIHRVVMGFGGVFGVYWGLFYMRVARKR